MQASASFHRVHLQRCQKLVVEDGVLVDSQHVRRCGERESSALVPEPNAILFDEKRSERVTDLVCVVSVRDVETHKYYLLHVHEG